MPASITLSGLSWSTPDGRPLFSNINLNFGANRVGLVGRNGIGKSTLLRLIAGEAVPQAGTVSRSGTIGILRQSVQPAGDETVAGLFGVSAALGVLRRAEAGAATAEELAQADWTLESRIKAALARFDLDLAADQAVSTLSGGQRTRVSLAALTFSAYDFLLLDEPTNNLDRAGRAAVMGLLTEWRGGAVVVSHDRALLEHMDAIVELTSLGARTYGGNWSRYRASKDLELAGAEHDLADATRRLDEVERAGQVAAERQAQRDRGGQKKSRRGDMPAIVAGGLKRKAEESAASGARLVERRRDAALADLAEARARIEILQPLSARITPTGLPAGRTVLRLANVSVGHVPGSPIISNLDFEIVGPERVAVAGPNGSGKTTLLSLATGALEPWSGSVSRSVPFAIFDQTVSLLDPSISIRDNFMRINSGLDENACRAALARFMFRADAALQVVSTLSGGQLLRAGLACVLGGPKPPQLLVLDEPTNHLDVDSIAAVEAGLAAYDGAMLVVSHDETFLEGIGISRRVELGSNGSVMQL